MERELTTKRWATECTESYIKIIRTFIEKNVIEPLVKARESRGMFDALEQPAEWDEEMDLNMNADSEIILWSWARRLTVLQRQR